MIEIRHDSEIDWPLLQSFVGNGLVATRPVPEPQISLPMVREILRRQWRHGTPLFRFVAIETRTGCNYTCSFCPVAKDRDPRSQVSMHWDLIVEIARQLEALDYSETILLFCNNEPLLDDRLPAIVGLFRGHCPDASIKILTNGILATTDLVRTLFDNGLTVLEIDNYSDGRRLTNSVRDLVHDAKVFAHSSIRINMRKSKDTLTNRAGSAPNVLPLSEPLASICALPFTDLNIMPSGRVTLCCFDALEQEVVGDITQQPITEIWKGDRLRLVRNALLAGDRSVTAICAVCDYNGRRRPPTTPHYVTADRNSSVATE